MKILIDNGHGSDTKGKRSPYGGALQEWAWTRDIAKRVLDKLRAFGYDVELVTPEENDISLSERVRRVNAECKKHGANNVVCVSIHNNAAGADDKWHDATGWSGWIAPNASANSKRLAQSLYAEAERLGLQGNRSVPAEKYWVGNFAIVRDTKCPAVLTENLFMDNEKEVDYLLSEEGKRTIADLHVYGITTYLNTL